MEVSIFGESPCTCPFKEAKQRALKDVKLSWGRVSPLPAVTVSQAGCLSFFSRTPCLFVCSCKTAVCSRRLPSLLLLGAPICTLQGFDSLPSKGGGEREVLLWLQHSEDSLARVCWKNSPFLDFKLKSTYQKRAGIKKLKEGNSFVPP